MHPKPTESPQNSNGENKEHRDHLWAIQNSIFSIGDLFKDVGREGPKSIKFPEKMLNVLEMKMQNIAMGKDAAYVFSLLFMLCFLRSTLIAIQTSMHICRTITSFYGSFKDDSFKRQMNENRKIEELILMFATTSTALLKKDPQLAGDG